MVAAGVLACNPFNSGNQLANVQQIQVTKGDLTIKVNGSGKIKVDTDANLTFGNNNGKILKLNVKEGDKVKKGEVLAQLETDSLELAITQATNAVAQAVLAEAQAASNLSTAQFALDKTKGYSDIRDKMTDLEWQIKAAETNMQQAQAIHDDGGAGYWRIFIANTRAALAQKSQDLATLLSKAEYTGTVTYDIMGDKYDRLTVDDMKTKQLAIETALKSIDQAKANTVQSQKQLSYNEKQLKDATIIAPNDGVVANLDMKVGDTVVPANMGGKPVIYLVDPASVQINAEIDEIDIANVKVGQKVNISLDAVAGKVFPGTVTYIDLVPVANPQNSGVVVYNTKVNFTSGIPPEVKIGMSATVDIITSEHTGVILVPSRSIRNNNLGKPVVDVLVNQQKVERAVTPGLTDGINTEITSGLSEGETIVINRTAQ